MRAKILRVEDGMDDEHPDFEHLSDEHLGLEEQLEEMEEHGGCLVRPHDVIVVRGEDRVRFVNGQVTCEVKKEQITMAYGYFTSPKGRIESEVWVHTEPDELRLVLPPGKGEEILARLRKYVITDRVEMSLRPAVAFYVLGKKGLRLLDPLARAIPQEPYQWVPYELQFQLQSLTRLPDLGIGRDVPCVVLLADDPQRNAETLSQTDLIALDEEAYQQLRIEAGRAEYETDYGSEHFPQEVGVAESVSYTKGCYLGQEVIARIHYRGGVQKHLRGLRIDASQKLPLVPLSLALEGQTVGKLSSCAPLPRGGFYLGIGIVHQKAAPGAWLDLVDAGGQSHGKAELVALPFPAPMPDLPAGALVN